MVLLLGWESPRPEFPGHTSSLDRHLGEVRKISGDVEFVAGGVSEAAETPMGSGLARMQTAMNEIIWRRVAE
jgi:hypothetical protein